MNDFSEAPASVTYTAKSPKGFELLFTVRADSGIELLGKLHVIEEQLVSLGYVYVERSKFGGGKKPEPVVVGTCPRCSGKLLEKKTKTGKTLWECEHRKFDFATKQESGTCTYTEWK